MDWQADESDDTSHSDAEDTQFMCPYCWQLVSPPLEEDLEGELVWDCEVCCRPWLIHISYDLGGERSIEVTRAQNG